MVIGITGKIGSGKSEVRSYCWARYGASCIDEDALAKEILNEDAAARSALIERFGDAIIGSDDKVDRELLRTRVYEDEENLRFLNELTHGLVRAAVEKAIAHMDEDEVLLIESALPKEAGFADLCDEIWYVACAEDERYARVHANRGMTLERFRILDEKQDHEGLREGFDGVFVTLQNDGSVVDLRQQIDEQFARIMMWE